MAWQAGELVFVEVRTLSARVSGPPEATIGLQKQRSLLRAVESFLAEYPAYERLPARMDVLAVRLTRPVELLLYQDAFR